MKHLIKIINICLLSIAFVACDDMYSIHQKYLDEGEQVYLGKATFVAVQAGKERVQLVWKLTADPKIEKCCIYWNSKADSMEIAPNYTDTVMRQILPLPEGSYVFEIKTKGKNNLSSLTSISSGKSYGKEYQSYLRNRVLRSQTVQGNSVTMKWGTEDNCVKMELEYTNNAGLKKKVELKETETQLTLSDFLPGGTFTYRSWYLPEKGAFETIPAKDQTDLFPTK